MTSAKPASRLPLYLFLLALGALLALTGWQWRQGAPISANLLDLLPTTDSDPLVMQAEQRMQEPLNRDLILLVRHENAASAAELVREIGQQWSEHRAFAHVQWSASQSLDALRAQLSQQRLGLLDARSRSQLLEAPGAFIDERLQQLFDPFAPPGLLDTAQDWFGLAPRILAALPGAGTLHIGSDGSQQVVSQGGRWHVLLARTQGDAFDANLPLAVSQRVDEARERVAEAGGELLAAGGLLYAAHGQQQARDESSLIGGLSLVGSLLLLLMVFRQLKVLAVLLPIGVGALAGTALCVALYGQIHVLTLVLGASLIGVTLDFPLHYLSKGWAVQPWHASRALRLALKGLLLALITNLIGYLALAFTPFPALTQVALFSAAGLLGALLCTTCLLPHLWRGTLAPEASMLTLARFALAQRGRLLARVPTPALLTLLGIFCVAGITQVDFRDDLRQWVARDAALNAQAQRIATLTGQLPTSQFFLVRAADADALLHRQAQLTERLDGRIQAGELQGYRALSQLVAPTDIQRATRQALPALLEASQPLQALGIPAPLLSEETRALAQQPLVTLQAALDGPLGEPWRPLWLGERDGGVAGMVSLQGLSPEADLQSLAAGLPGVTWVDRPTALNQLFADTQRHATALKLLASVLIVLMLWRPFGLPGALRCVAVPLLAALASLATLGWLGHSLTLFGLFGLLLVTAIGVDYAILMRERVGGPAVSLLGTLLSAVTTWLSFGLLALSSTPAVSNFGLTVSLGLVFAFLFAPWASPDQKASPTEAAPAGCNNLSQVFRE